MSWAQREFGVAGVCAVRAFSAAPRDGALRGRAMSVIAWIALGAIGGLAAGWFLRARGRALLGDLAVGVLGAIIGGFLASVLLGLDVADLDFTSILVAAMGAALLILVLHSLPTVDVFE